MRSTRVQKKLAHRWFEQVNAPLLLRSIVANMEYTTKITPIHPLEDGGVEHKFAELNDRRYRE